MNASASAAERVLTARDLRRQRARRLVLRMGVFVVLPTLLAAIYYGALASPQYESTTAFTIQSADGGGGAGGLELIIGSLPGSSAARDSLLVRDHVLSRDMLTHLVEEQGYLEHYASERHDLLSRLGADVSSEQRFGYYLDHVDIAHDSKSGVLTLQVRAFSADYAAQLAEAILEASHQMVNRMMLQARRDRLALAQHEVDSAEARLTKARQAVVREQVEGHELNPLDSAASLLTVRGSLEAEAASARAELAALRATLQADAPRVVEQRQRVSAINRQIESINERLASDEGGLQEAIARFEPLVAEREFSEHGYQFALKGLELARVDADRQHRYLVTIASPSHPDGPTHPRFWHSVLTVLLLSFVLLGVGTLLVASVREHANV
ncbi:MAG: hypothetical protein OEY14_07810 [Myxococcales bacterium]|nr:hypothetical protein [Myxococcales bacterium]